MRVLYLYTHPLDDSFHAAIRRCGTDALQGAGHEIDLVDLYADGFDPVLGAEGRRHYHDTERNRLGLEGYIERLQAADAMVVQFPTWCFGPPAMLKGFFDRVFAPGVAFDLSDPGRVRPLLGHIRRLAGISTYGRPRLHAMWVGDPPRRLVTGYLRWFIARDARVDYTALYHMNVASEARRVAFLGQVEQRLRRF